MTTRYPKSGKGRRWTIAELRAIPLDWKGDIIADSDGLTGEVRVTNEDAVAVRFRFAFKWGGKVSWYQCGSWPGNSLEVIRRHRDDARNKVKAGINPNDAKKAARIEAQQQVEAVIAADAQRRAEDLTNNDLIDTWLRDGVRRKDGNHELGLKLDKNVRPFIGTKPVRLTTEHDLRDLLRVIVARGANRLAVTVYTNLAQMYHWAEKRQPWRRLLVEGNPIDLIEVGRIVDADYDLNNVRTRVLAENELVELRDIFTAMDSDAAGMTRHALYDRVWATPIMRLAQQLGISDRGLAKICARRNIPTPDRGYWRKRENSVAVRARPLPDPDWNPWVDLVRSQRGLAKKHQCAIWLCLGTTCRIGELLLAEQEHVNLDKREWFIPKANVKGTRGTKTDHLVLLNDFSVRQFELLLEMAGESRWIFPSPEKESAPIHHQAVTAQVGDRQLMFKALGKKPNRRPMDNGLVLSSGDKGEWTPHDMRRTSATMMQALGVDPNVIDRCQNHVLQGSKVRRHYMLHDYAEEKRQAWDKLGKHLDRLLSQKRPYIRKDAELPEGVDRSTVRLVHQSAASGSQVG
ncbi:site-specific integrase [Paucibacter sp. O1-1]|nr:site-specific integrase [Paucibacter sp. O1-1]MDA3831115.1 site-specific integrase [Paucibacter sp. O1-1]